MCPANENTKSDRINTAILRLYQKYGGNRFAIAKDIKIKYSVLVRKIEELKSLGKIQEKSFHHCLNEWAGNGQSKILRNSFSTPALGKPLMKNIIPGLGACCLSPSGFLIPNTELMRSLFPKKFPKEDSSEKHIKMPFNLKWLDGGLLMDRWGLDAFELMWLIMESGFPAYDLEKLTQVDPNERKSQFTDEWLSSLVKKPREAQREILARLRFPFFIVERFEEVYGKMLNAVNKEIDGLTPGTDENSKDSDSNLITDDLPDDENEEFDLSLKSEEDDESEGPKRHSTKCKMKCREIAGKIWESNPSITIREMTEREEILEHSKNLKGDLYSDNTIREWIKDLCPNRSPGRPKKTKN